MSVSVTTSGAPLLIGPHDPGWGDPTVCGTKASRLAQLPPSMQTPPGLVLRTGALHERLWPLVAGTARDGAALRTAIASLALPDVLLAALDTVCATFAGMPLAVRSSSASEDGLQRSAAGIFESIIGVPPRRAPLARAVRRVWASALAERARPYAASDPAVALEQMAILIQPLVDAYASGVAFSHHPLWGDTPLIEAAPGLAFPLVDGIMVPDRYHLHRREAPGPPRVEAADKRLAYVLAHEWYARKAGDPVVWSARGSRVQAAFLKYVAYDVAAIRLAERAHSLQPLLDDVDLAALAEHCARLTDYFGYPVDIEWALAGRALIILQVRPITTRPAPRPAPGTAPATVDSRFQLVGSGLAGGIAAGQVVTPRTAVTDQPSVLVVDDLRPEYIADVLPARAVITGRGGLLSHLAILCRELGKPCVYLPAYSTLRPGTQVRVDGDRGQVDIVCTTVEERGGQ